LNFLRGMKFNRVMLFQRLLYLIFDSSFELFKNVDSTLLKRR
jgi:hypothetical protein